MRNFPSLKKIMSLFGALLVVFGVLIYFAIYHVINTNKDIAQLAHTMYFETKKQQNIISTEALVDKANPDIAQVTSSIIPSDGDVAFIEYIESVARLHGLQIIIDSLSLEQDAALSRSSMNKLNIKMEVKGSWNGVYLFTSQIESFPYIVKINKIGIVNSKDTASLDVLKNIPASGSWQEIIEMSVLKRI